MTAPRSAPGSSASDPRADWLTVTVACVGFFVITLDATVVNMALPSIGAHLHGDTAGLQWVVDAYTLVFAALMLSSGALSDSVGASRAFGTGLLVFTAASAFCGLAPTLGLLLAARVLQGVAAAAMLPASRWCGRPSAIPSPAPRAWPCGPPAVARPSRRGRWSAGR